MIDRNSLTGRADFITQSGPGAKSTAATRMNHETQETHRIVLVCFLDFVVFRVLRLSAFIRGLG